MQQCSDILLSKEPTYEVVKKVLVGLITLEL